MTNRSELFDGSAARDTLPPDAPATNAEPPASRRCRKRCNTPASLAVSSPLDGWYDEEALEAGFVSDARLADMLFRRVVRRAARGIVESDGRRFQLCPAIKVVSLPRGADLYGLLGAVESHEELMRAGATLAADTMRLGPLTYRIERGMVVKLAGS